VKKEPGAKKKKILGGKGVQKKRREKGKGHDVRGVEVGEKGIAAIR